MVRPTPFLIGRMKALSNSNDELLRNVDQASQYALVARREYIYNDCNRRWRWIPISYGPAEITPKFKYTLFSCDYKHMHVRAHIDEHVFYGNS